MARAQGADTSQHKPPIESLISTAAQATGERNRLRQSALSELMTTSRTNIALAAQQGMQQQAITAAKEQKAMEIEARRRENEATKEMNIALVELQDKLGREREELIHTRNLAEAQDAKKEAEEMERQIQMVELLQDDLDDVNLQTMQLTSQLGAFKQNLDQSAILKMQLAGEQTQKMNDTAKGVQEALRAEVDDFIASEDWEGLDKTGMIDKTGKALRNVNSKITVDMLLNPKELQASLSKGSVTALDVAKAKMVLGSIRRDVIIPQRTKAQATKEAGATEKTKETMHPLDKQLKEAVSAGRAGGGRDTINAMLQNLEGMATVREDMRVRNEAGYGLRWAGGKNILRYDIMKYIPQSPQEWPQRQSQAVADIRGSVDKILSRIDSMLGEKNLNPRTIASLESARRRAENTFVRGKTGMESVEGIDWSQIRNAVSGMEGEGTANPREQILSAIRERNPRDMTGGENLPGFESPLLPSMDYENLATNAIGPRR